MATLTSPNQNNTQAFVFLQTSQNLFRGMASAGTEYYQQSLKAIANYKMAQVALETRDEEQTALHFEKLQKTMYDKSLAYEIRALPAY